MRRLFNLWPARQRRMERDLERELRDHLDRRIADLRRADPRLTEDEARRLAALEFGGVAQVREDVRDTWGSRCGCGTARIRYGLGGSLWRGSRV